jgi:hypothetical protein
MIVLQSFGVIVMSARFDECLSNDGLNLSCFVCVRAVEVLVRLYTATVRCQCMAARTRVRGKLNGIVLGRERGRYYVVQRFLKARKIQLPPMRDEYHLSYKNQSVNAV